MGSLGCGGGDPLGRGGSAAWEECGACPAAPPYEARGQHLGTAGHQRKEEGIAVNTQRGVIEDRKLKRGASICIKDLKIGKHLSGKW